MLAVHGGVGSGRTISAGRLRAMFWPDGRVCWQVNIYLNALCRRGLTVSTVNTYCAELAQYVRFLGMSGATIEGCTDDTLREFSAWLGAKPCKPASARHRNRIILNVLRFLEWLQGILPLRAPLIGCAGDGAQVTVTVSAWNSNGSTARRLHHPALEPNNVATVVRPIAGPMMERLMSAVTQTAKGRFVRSRNMALLKVLADCGLRRQEAAWLSVRSLELAAATGRLIVRTAKRRGNPLREVPIPNVSAMALLRYVNVDRAIHIEKLRRKRPLFEDAGWAFCTLRGSRLADASITQFITKLRLSAGISERATAHMFRHRWITLQVVERLRALNARGPAGVELLTTLLSRIASLTGHASLSSLWTYVDWACEEAGTWRSIDSTAAIGTEVRALQREVRSALRGASQSGANTATGDGFRDLLSSLDLFLNQMLHPTPSEGQARRALSAHSLRKDR